MKVYTFSQARQNLADVLNQSKGEGVLIRRRGGGDIHGCTQTKRGLPSRCSGCENSRHNERYSECRS